MEKTVYFRAFEEEDAELIYQWMNDDELKNLSVGVNRRMCREEAREWVRIRMKDSRNQVFWAICSKDTNKMIGYASLVNIHYINSSAETGAILIGDKDYNDGLAWIEAALFMFEYGFERLNLNRIYGVCFKEHKMSCLMAKALHEETEGIMRQAVFKNGKYHDLVYSAMLKDDYFIHKNSGDYEIRAMIKKLAKLKNE